jgi:hypothetical protein
MDAAYYSYRNQASPPLLRRLGKGTDQRRFIAGFDKAPVFAMRAAVMAVVTVFPLSILQFRSQLCRDYL